MTDFLTQWKATKQKECLLIRGARQIGKTIEDFAKNNYDYFVEINFEQQPVLKTAFDGELTVPEMIKRITIHLRQKAAFTKTSLPTS